MPRTSDNQSQSDVNETDIDALEASVASNTTAVAKVANVTQAQVDLLAGVSAGTVTASKAATYDGSSALKAVTFAESVNGGRFATSADGHVLTRGVYVDAAQGTGDPSVTPVPLPGALNMPTTRTFLYTGNKRLRLVNTDADAPVLTTSSSEFITLQSNVTTAQNTADACLPLAGGTVTGALSVNGVTTLDNAAASIVAVSTQLTCNGNTTLGNAITDTTAITGPATVGGTLSVTGATTLNGVQVPGPSKTFSITVDGAGATPDHLRLKNVTDSKILLTANPAGDMNVGVSGRTTACMGNYVVNGSCTAASYITGSDQSMKADVQDVASASAERLLGVRPVTYLIDGDTSGMRHAGVIAQEVETAVPECVRTMDNGTKGVEYQYLSMFLLKHVQELTARVAALEAAASS